MPRVIASLAIVDNLKDLGRDGIGFKPENQSSKTKSCGKTRGRGWVEGDLANSRKEGRTNGLQPAVLLNSGHLQLPSPASSDTPAELE